MLQGAVHGGEWMKTKVFVSLFLFLLLLSGCTQMMRGSQTGTKKLLKKMTLIEALTFAYSDAVKWNKGAMLVDAKSVDSDEEIVQFDGKRRYWDITFGVPHTHEAFLVSIRDGEINNYDISDEGVPVHSNDYFITDLSEIKIDSPELLKKVISTTKLYPSDTWTKSYSYGISKDIDKDIVLIKIFGWGKEREKFMGLQFNASTGEFLKRTVVRYGH